MTKSGEIDDFDVADELATSVGRATGLDRLTAAAPLAIVRKLLSSLHITREMIEVRAEQVFVHLPTEADKVSAIRAELSELQLLSLVTLMPAQEPPSTPVSVRTARTVQALLFE